MTHNLSVGMRQCARSTADTQYPALVQYNHINHKCNSHNQCSTQINTAAQLSRTKSKLI
jgi:hypothetical protein